MSQLLRPTSRSSYAAAKTWLFILGFTISLLAPTNLAGAEIFETESDEAGVATEDSAEQTLHPEDEQDFEPALEQQDEEHSSPATELPPEETEPTSLAAEDLPIVASNPDEEDVQAEVHFVCWSRESALEYSFIIDISDDVNNADNPEYFETTPATDAALLPESLPDGETTITGWHGQDFTWHFGSNDVLISQGNQQCDGETILERLANNPQTDDIADFIEDHAQLAGYCSDLFLTLDNRLSKGGFVTFFSPTETGLFETITPPGIDPTAELVQLNDNPDEICAILSSHVAMGDISTYDIPSGGLTAPVIDNDLNGIFLTTNSAGDVYADDARVTEANMVAENGLFHVVDRVITPQSYGEIDPIATDKTSPAITGSIVGHTSLNMCVLVRINGLPYLAQVDGSHWHIEAGTVELNPTRTSTQFDVVVRYPSYVQYELVHSDESLSYTCDEAADEIIIVPTSTMNVASGTTMTTPGAITHGGELLGITIARDILTYATQSEASEDESEGQVLGETSSPNPAPLPQRSFSVASANPTSTAAQIIPNDPSTTDSDGDGVVDSEDPEPNNPDVNGLETIEPAIELDEDRDNNGSDEEPNILLWFIVGGGAVAIWYVLWQRSGRET